MGTRAAWAAEFARALGNPSPSPAIVRWVSAWTVGEGTKARFNPLATKWQMPGNTNFNSEGVKNYTTRAEGLEATVKTISREYPGYKDMREGIRTNDAERAMRGLYVAPWGTNGSKVDRIYRSTRSIESEPLAAEEGSGDTSAAPAPAAPAPPLVDTGSKPWQPAGDWGAAGGGGGGWSDVAPFSSDELRGAGRRAAYVVLGLGLVGLSLIIGLRTLVPTEQIVKTVAEVAL